MLNFLLEGEPQGNGTWLLIVILVLMVGMMLFMSFTNKKRNQKAQEMLDALKPGDKIRTIGGIFGTVKETSEITVTIEIGKDDQRTLMVIAKAAVAQVDPLMEIVDEEEDKKASEGEVVEVAQGEDNNKQDNSEETKKDNETKENNKK